MAPITSFSPLVPAHLIIGYETQTTKHAYELLQKIFCKNACSTCHICQQIKENQHPSITWLCPERWYTRETLQPLFARIIFALDQNEQYFFVLQKSDHFLPHAANSLLKSLEEPPAGYHFLLLAQQHDLVLPTIRSRCTITILDKKNDDTIATHALAKLFDKSIPSATTFVATLEKTSPSEQETRDILHYLFNHWQQKLKANLSKNKEDLFITHVVDQLRSVITHPIPSGSSKLVWKNCYLQLMLYGC